MSTLDRSEVMRLYRRHVNSGMARVYELMNSVLEAESSGNWIVGHDGSRFLDCAGYCVFLLGHGHPAIVAAVREQLESHAISSRVLPHAAVALASAKLASVAPDGLDYVWFGSGGAEAVEAALKLVRAAGRKRLIAMEGAYHGKTLGALSVSGRAGYRAPFEPLLQGVTRVPFGDINALRAALSDSHGDVAVLMEPIQSEAGVIVPPPGYLREAKGECLRQGALLVVDEISTGLGRTGHWWSSVAQDATPDILIAGKTLGGGLLPVSAVVASEAAFAPFNREPLLHTSTFSGNPLACVAARATIEAIEQEDVLPRALEMGGALLKELKRAAHECSVVKDVRGAGLLLGVEFTEEHQAADFMLEMMSRKVLVSHSSYGHRVARITPSATLTSGELEQVAIAARDSMRAVEARYGRQVI